MERRSLGLHAAVHHRFGLGTGQLPETVYTRRITADDIVRMEAALEGEALPWDFEEKLRRLAAGDLLHSSIAQNCRLFLSVCRAARSGAFKIPTSAAYERLLTVLAYVRKHDDVIPDDERDGFTDDFHFVKSTASELHGLLEQFKTWRLRNEVPFLWQQRAERAGCV